MNQLEAQYQSALDYLYGFVDYSLTRQLTFSAEKFNLDRMVQLMALLGNPQNNYGIIHVTGTKGKGSVSAITSNILQSAGYSVGLYTSPHLIDFTERIQVNGNNIAQAAFVNLIQELKPIVEQVPELTTFEISTALGLLYFSRCKVDLAVVEVGLGGRLDATNIVDPLVSVITAISYDHQALLGNTLAEIAGEKAGIIKPGKPVVVSSQNPVALAVIEKAALKHKSQISLIGRDVKYTAIGHDLKTQRFQVWSTIEDANANDQSVEEYELSLLGAHQLENAATAYAAVSTLRNLGYHLSDDAFRQGFRTVNWPCRFDIICDQPYIILDSAHNRDSAQKLRATLDDYFPNRQVVLLFGASEDKDIRGMLEELIPRVSYVVATQSIHPRAQQAEEIVKLVHELGCLAEAVLPFNKAFQKAIQLADDNKIVMVAGSIFIAAAAKEQWMISPFGTEKDD